MKFQRALAGAVFLALAASGTALAASGKDNPKQKRIDGQVIGDCTVAGQKQGAFTVSGVTSGWPPNHKPKDIKFTLTDTSSPNGVTIDVAGKSDEAPDANGSGNTDTDFLAAGTASGTGTATANMWYLSERAGNGNGRVYTWTITGSVNGPGATGMTPCAETITYKTYVVHDQGGGNDAGQDLPPAP